MGDSPLRPKTFWRYLGFYFDWQLTFWEHVRYYSTKAISTVRAMGMLGNSLRGLTPKQKRLLYRSCVVPIATYSFRLWCHGLHPHKAHLASLNKMQRRAAIWITGAFHTSPSGGVEALAGLIPIHLHLRKLRARASYRVLTLSPTHPSRQFLGMREFPGVDPHRYHFTRLGRSVEKVRSTIVDTLLYLSAPITLEAFDADASEARPGRRLMDWFSDRIRITDFPPREEDVNVLHILNAELDRALALDDCVVVATDASVGRDKAYQAVSAAWVWAGGVPVRQSRQAAGRVTTPDAELHAIRMGVFAACAQEGARHIVLFTDHPASARRAVDPSVGSGQAQALLVCRRLARWLEGDPSRTFAFVQVRSSLEWPLHHTVHRYAVDPAAQELVGVCPFTTLNYLRTAEAQACHDEWTRQFACSSSSGRDFLHLTDERGKRMTPTYLSGGTWLKHLHDSLFCAHVCRAVLNHAPIGEFRRWFNLSHDHSCPCGSTNRQTRKHVLTECTDFSDPRCFPKCWKELLDFCKENPRAFSFAHLPAG
ncbi:hypothetical protein AN958_11546 [Leucoagaricus sp. SymC.cos]|nr:hypothetical protein AN958_11546 [Leucoagaricus sp. SymC.cos]